MIVKAKCLGPHRKFISTAILLKISQTNLKLMHDMVHLTVMDVQLSSIQMQNS